MRRHLSQFLAVLTLGFAIAASAPSFAQPQPGGAAPAGSPTTAATSPQSDDERAMDLFRKGIDAHKQGQLAEAEGFYHKAFDLKKSYDIAGNLGDVELKLGRVRDAAEHLSFTIKNFPLTGRPELRERMQNALKEAKAQVGSVRVSVSVDRADIFIDGVKVGASPLQDEIFVDPGPHKFEAKLKEHKPAAQEIQATKGVALEVKLTLIPEIPPPPPKRSKVPAVVLGVVAGVGAGVGIGTFLASNSKLKKAEDLTNTIRNEHGTCAEGAASPHASCGELSSTKSSVNTLDAVAISGASVAGLALVGMIVYLALPNPTAPGRPATTGLRVNVAPTASSDGGGLLVTGSF